MRLALVSFKPQVVPLENRWQPGSLLMTSVETSLLAGGIAPLLDVNTQDQHSATALHAVSPTESSMPAAGSPQAAPQPGIDHGDLNFQPITVTDAVVDPVAGASIHATNPLPTAPRATPLGRAVTFTPIEEGHGPGTQGGACESDGNVIVDGDFETIPVPPNWFWNDPFGFTGVVVGGGHLTPMHHLETGTPIAPAVVRQDVATDVDQVYDITLSVRLDGPVTAPHMLVLTWNGDTVMDFSDMTPSGSWTRVSIPAAVTGTGADRFQFTERHEANYWHLDDICVTPVVA